MVRLKRNFFALISLGVIILMGLAAALAPWLTSRASEGLGDPNPSHKLLAPSSDHLLGTDHLGRDLYARILFGARTSLTLGLGVVILGSIVGTTLGIVAGYFRGSLDEVIMRVAEVFMAFPQLLLAVAIATAFGSSLINALIAISLTWWPWYARLMRAQVLVVRQRDFVVAAQALGATSPHLLLRHVLPNALTPVLIQAASDFGAAILTGAALSFLGIGIQPPTADWGQMINAARAYFPEHWWYAAFPGLALVSISLAFGILGDELHLALDSRLNRAQS